MTGITMTAGTHAADQIGLTQARVARSEWIKLRSLRSTLAAMAAFVVVTAGTGLLLCGSALSRLNEGKHVGTSTAALSLYGAYLAPLTVGVLGTLLVTAEYSSGMIRATLSAVPRRLPVLWAKLGVFAAVAVVASEVTLIVTFLAGQALLAHTHAGASFADPGVLRAVLGTGLYIAVVGLFGIALGFLLRNTAGAISMMFGVMLMLPVLVNVLPADWSGHVARYLPSNAGQAIMAVRPLPDTLAPWTGLALFAGYTVLVVAAAAICLKRRDA
jgi:ABC-type transport system involved in multi-copper enzyme maturation permease subunit